jgi:AcrR family transcriptional regulator
VDGEDPAPRRRLTQAEAKARTRGQLLAAAASVFAAKGFAGASLEEIAEVAGYSTGAVYHHFANKEQLFLEVLRTGSPRQTAARTAAITGVFDDAADGGGDPFDVLSAGVAELAGRELSPLAAEFWLYAVRNPDAMHLIAASLGEEDRGLEPVMARAMRRFGTPAGISAEELALVAVTLFNGLVRRRRIDPDAVPDDLYARVLRRLFGAEPGGGQEAGPHAGGAADPPG